VVDTEAAWTTVERALDSAAREYPAAADDPITDWDVSTLQSVIVAIGGSGSIQELWHTAEALESRLRSIPGVRDVEIVPEVARDVSITTDNAVLDSLGISRPYLAGQLSDRFVPTVGGAITVGTLRSSVGTGTSIESVERIGDLQIPLPTGDTIPLASIGSVEVVQKEPLSAVVRVDNATAVTVGISAQDSIDVVAFGERIASEIDAFAESHPHRTIEYVSFQPGRVALQLSDLLGSLLQAFGIVASIVILAMGMRLGLTVATMVPVVALAGLAVFAAFGGVLHQISIAALVMSLGLLVDNAIVVAERIQWRLDRGESRFVAAGAAIRELLVPLGAATGTTLAAYIPLLLARGDTAEFTGAIPRVVMLTLTLSYFFAVIVTPTISMLTLRRRPDPATPVADSIDTKTAKQREGIRDRLHRSGLGSIPARAGSLATRRPKTIVAVVTVAVVGSVALLPFVKQQFFPSTDRNQLVVDVEIAQGSHISETSRVLGRLEREISTWPETRSVASFSGRTAPRFYYNVLTTENAPYRGQLLVTTTDSAVVPILADRIRTFARAETPEASVVAKKLEQGPPVNAPIEIRIAGDDPQGVAEEVLEITSLLREIPGAIDVRTTLSSATPTVQFVVDDGRLHELGVPPRHVSTALLGATRGIPVGEVRYQDEEIPVFLRSETGEDTTPEELRRTTVFAPRLGETVPITAFSRIETRMQREEISRRDGNRVASVQAQLAPGAAYNQVLGALTERLGEPPEGIDRAIGGAAEESAEANSAIAEASYLGVIVLLTILLLQFRSFRKVFIINMTIPLAAVGVIPGLVIFDQPFGFTSMLGAIALVGIVVNNAIILIDLTDTKRGEGALIDAALQAAVAERFRPIVLTAATTIAGMVPLLFSSSSLWPPFAGAVVSGLSVSTVLTILVVPALYRLLFRDSVAIQTGVADANISSPEVA
jgi:multidrug efflux pump subunit AcrB